MLFANFAVPSKQVTVLHYNDDLDIPIGLARLVPLRPEPEAVAESEPVAETSWAGSEPGFSRESNHQTTPAASARIKAIIATTKGHQRRRFAGASGKGEFGGFMGGYQQSGASDVDPSSSRGNETLTKGGARKARRGRERVRLVTSTATRRMKVCNGFMLVRISDNDGGRKHSCTNQNNQRACRGNSLMK